MFKKLVCLIMAATFMLGLSGCDSTDKQAAYDLFMNAAKQVNEESGRYLNLMGMLNTEYADSKSFFSIGGYYMTQESESGGQLVDSIFSMSTTTEEQPQQYEYLSDGEKYAYVYNEEINEMSKEEFDKATAYGTIITAFEASDVKSAKMEQGEKNTTYELTLDKKNTTELATALLESISLIDTSAVPVEFKNSEVIATIVVDGENKPVSFKFELETDATAQGETMAIDYMISFSVYGTGEDVKVGVSDLESYLTQSDSSSETTDSSETASNPE